MRKGRATGKGVQPKIRVGAPEVSVVGGYPDQSRVGRKKPKKGLSKRSEREVKGCFYKGSLEGEGRTTRKQKREPWSRSRDGWKTLWKEK